MTALAAEAPALVGNQVPTIKHVPAYVTSAGPEVCALADQAGLILDPWQRLVLTESLGERADGKWAAFEAAVIVARQNGKSAIFEARCIAGLFLLEEELIIYSAHQFKTSQEIFRRVLAIIERTPSFKRRVKFVSKSKGDEGIELTTGQRLRFVARTGPSGRGFSGDVVIWDEAQILGDEPVDALMPTMLARPNAQLWYGGSAADRSLAPCEQIARVRSRALEGGPAADGLAFFEWSATLCSDQCPTGCTAHDDRDDPRTWAKVNPALGSRIQLETIGRLHGSMSRRGFNRELLSVGNYPVAGSGWSVISQEAWEATSDPEVVDEAGNVVSPGSQTVGPVAFAVDVAPDRSAASIAVAGRRDDGQLHVELVDHRPGTAWVVKRMKGLIETWSPCAIGLDAGGPAGSLESEFLEAGIELAKPKAREVAAAAGQIYDAVMKPPDADDDWATALRHHPHPALTSALEGATKRSLGDAWTWDRRTEGVILSPLVAVTLAAWAFATRPPEEQASVPMVAWR